MMMMLFMATVALTASAQNEVGQLTLQPKIGLNLANVSDAGKINDESSKMKADFAVGVEAEYGLSEKFSVAAGVLYSLQGCDYGEYKLKINGETVSGYDKNQYNLGYLNIPIVANFYFAKGWAIKAGVQPGFLLSAKNKVDGVGATPSVNDDIKDKECPALPPLRHRGPLPPPAIHPPQTTRSTVIKKEKNRPEATPLSDFSFQTSALNCNATL